MSTKWPLIKAKYLLSRQNHPANEEEGTVTAFRDGEVVLRSERRTDGFTEAEKYIGYQGVRPGDLVIHAMDAFAGAIGISKSKGKMSPVVHIYSAGPEIDLRFYSYYLRHLAKIGYIQSLSKGIRERSTAFDPAMFSQLELPKPSIEDQRLIADYLDAQIAIMDAIIDLKRQGQKLLENASQSEFTKIFGHPFFSSENKAKSRRLGPCLLANDGGVWGDDPVGSGDSLVLRSTEISRRGYWRDLDSAAYRKLEEKEAINSRLMAGDIVVTKASGSPDHIGKAAIATEEIEDLKASFGNFMQRIRVNPAIYLPAYIHYFLKSYNARSQFNFLGTTSTGLMNVSAEVLNNLRVPLVSLEEQQETIYFLKEIEKDFDTRLDLVDQSISTFVEFKNALIAAAVTGTFEINTGRNLV
jgi:type I restriction enzyme, S subunit